MTRSHPTKGSPRRPKGGWSAQQVPECREAWYLVIDDHQEVRAGFAVTVYSPVVIPEGENTQSLRARYCSHRHTSYDAARACGKRTLRAARHGK